MVVRGGGREGRRAQKRKEKESRRAKEEKEREEEKARGKRRKRKRPEKWKKRRGKQKKRKGKGERYYLRPTCEHGHECCQLLTRNETSTSKSKRRNHACANKAVAVAVRAVCTLLFTYSRCANNAILPSPFAFSLGAREEQQALRCPERGGGKEH